MSIIIYLDYYTNEKRRTEAEGYHDSRVLQVIMKNNRKARNMAVFSLDSMPPKTVCGTGDLHLAPVT